MITFVNIINELAESGRLSQEQKSYFIANEAIYIKLLGHDLQKIQRLFWFINHPVKKHCLTVSELFVLLRNKEALKSLMECLTHEDLIPLILHPEFPYTVSELQELSQTGIEALFDEEVRDLVMAKTFSSVKVINIYLEERASTVPDTHRRIAYLNLRQTGVPVFPGVGGPEGGDSIHKVEVNDSAARSLRDLNCKFAQKLEGEKYLAIIQDIYNWLDKLPKEQSVTIIAHRVIKRLTTSFYGCYVDPKSKLSTSRAVALTWLAINDTSENGIYINMECGDKSLAEAVERSVLQARQAFLKELIAMEFKNLDDLELEAVTATEKPDPACHMSTHNRLALALSPVHKLVKVECASIQERQTMNFQGIVQAVVARYLDTTLHTDPANAKRFVEKCNAASIVEELFPDIQVQIRTDLYSKFKGLYRNNTDPELIKLVAQAIYVNVEKEYSYFVKKYSELQMGVQPGAASSGKLY